MPPYNPNRTVERNGERKYNENVKCTDNKLITIMIDDLSKRCYKCLDAASGNFKSNYRMLECVALKLECNLLARKDRLEFDNVFYLETVADR